MVDLNNELNKANQKARSGGGGTNDVLRSLLTHLPSGEGQEIQREMESMERIRAEPNQPGGKKPEDMSPQELHSVLWQVLSFRDRGKFIGVLAEL